MHPRWTSRRPGSRDSGHLDVVLVRAWPPLPCHDSPVLDDFEDGAAFRAKASSAVLPFVDQAASAYRGDTRMPTWGPWRREANQAQTPVRLLGPASSAHSRLSPRAWT